MRTIMVCVDSRATWSRALTVCEAIQKRKDLKLQLVLVGPLAQSSGSVLDEIKVTAKLPGFNPAMNMAEIAGYLTYDIARKIAVLKPCIVVSVTDRYESLAVAVAAVLSGVHLAHIQGGEVSGCIDESIRHAITKLAHIHFPANQDSADRIMRLGEDPAYVFDVGCPATDLLLRVNIGPNPVFPYILVNYNPVTTIPHGMNFKHMQDILDACDSIDPSLEVKVVGPNHDPGSGDVWEAIHKWSQDYELIGADAPVQASLPHPDFISLMAHASVLVGNSSAGIREACYFGTPVVDVGIRQQGRACTRNVLIVSAPDRDSIEKTIAFQLGHGRYPPERPFGNGGAGAEMARILAEAPLPPLQKHITH